jgi:molybdopterin synthase sulfur carrier subunit
VNLTICYFGLLAERRGLAQEKIDASASTPAAVYAELDVQYRLGLAVTDIRAAVNDEFVSFQHPLAENDTLAFLPPMSGG